MELTKFEVRFIKGMILKEQWLNPGKTLYVGMHSHNFYVGLDKEQICDHCGKPYETVPLPVYTIEMEDGTCVTTRFARRSTKRISGGARGYDA